MREQLQLRRKGESTFLKNYQIAGRVLKNFDPDRGTPTLRSGVSSKTGESVLIRTWPRTGDDDDLREIWKNEIRQLSRLRALRSAGEVTAQLLESGVDEVGFHIAVKAGQKMPVAWHLQRSDRLAYANRTSARARLVFWSNIARVVSGLELLHSQGMLHRSLNLWAILTSNGSQSDFELTGFEWSMRLSGIEDQPVKKRKKSAALSGEYSFRRDWGDLGEVIMTLLEMPPRRTRDLSFPSHEVADYLTAAETRLVRELLQVIATDRLDGETIRKQIEHITLVLTAAVQNEELLFQLVVPLAAQGKIIDRIREAADENQGTDDASLISFIENDLSNASAISIRDGSVEGYRIALRGTRLTYHLEDLLRTRDKVPSNWQQAYCSYVTVNSQGAATPLTSVRLFRTAISVISQLEFGRLRVRSRPTSWRVLWEKLRPPKQADAEVFDLCRSLILDQVLDYVFAASDVYPISIARRSSSQSEEGRTQIVVRPAKSDDRDRLAKTLGLKGTSAARLAEALTGDRVRDDRKVTWTLTDKPTLGEKSETVSEWSFVEECTLPDGSTGYVFIGDAPATALEDLYLVPGDSTGRDAQLQRRLKFLSALLEQGELGALLVNPR